MLEYLDPEQLPAIAPLPEVLQELRHLCSVSWTERVGGESDVKTILLYLVQGVLTVRYQRHQSRYPMYQFRALYRGAHAIG
jgi:hypothetical protein